MRAAACLSLMALGGAGCCCCCLLSQCSWLAKDLDGIGPITCSVQGGQIYPLIIDMNCSKFQLSSADYSRVQLVNYWSTGQHTAARLQAATCPPGMLHVPCHRPGVQLHHCARCASWIPSCVCAAVARYVQHMYELLLVQAVSSEAASSRKDA